MKLMKDRFPDDVKELMDYFWESVVPKVDSSFIRSQCTERCNIYKVGGYLDVVTSMNHTPFGFRVPIQDFYNSRYYMFVGRVGFTVWQLKIFDFLDWDMYTVIYQKDYYDYEGIGYWA